MKPLETGVPAVDKAMQILDYLRQAGSASFSSIEEALKIPKSTLSRQLSSLKAHGLLRQSADKYALGLRLYELGQASYANYDLKEAALPHMQALKDCTGLTCHLGILEGLQPVYLAKVESPYVVIVRSYVGKRLPVHSTALGKVLLAYSDAELVSRIIVSHLPFERFTARTMVEEADLRAQLAKVREEGYAMDDEEDNEGVRCFAAPVFSFDGTIAAAVSVTGVIAQYKDLPLEELLPKLKECAQRISTTLH